MDKKSKRDLMLEAAFKLFLKYGYNDTKVIDIAETAGVGKGTVYEYFPSKEILFSQVFHDKILSEYNKIYKSISKGKNAEDKLRIFISFEIENSRKYGDTLQILPEMVMNSSALKNKELQKLLSLLWESRFKAMHSIIVEGIASGEFLPNNSEMTAISLLGSVNFYILYVFDMMPKDWPQIVNNQTWELSEFLKIILCGISKTSR